MGGKIVGGAFTASVKSLVQLGRASSKYLGQRHTLPPHLYTSRFGGCLSERYYPWNMRRATTLTNLLSVYSSVLQFLESLGGCFGTFSGTERPSLVKLPIAESVVKVLPSTSSLCYSYQLIRFV